MGQPLQLPGNNNGLNNVGGLTGSQIDLISNLGANTGGVENLGNILANPSAGLLGGGNLGAGVGTLGSILNTGNPIDVSALQQQASNQFNNLLAPQINNQFGALGLGSSSARDAALARAAGEVSTNAAVGAMPFLDQAKQRQLAGVGILGDQQQRQLQSQIAGGGLLQGAAGLNLQGQLGQAGAGQDLLQTFAQPAVQTAQTAPPPASGQPVGGTPTSGGPLGRRTINRLTTFEHGGEVPEYQAGGPVLPIANRAAGLINPVSLGSFGGRADLGDFLSNLVFGHTFNRPTAQPQEMYQPSRRNPYESSVPQLQAPPTQPVAPSRSTTRLPRREFTEIAPTPGTYSPGPSRSSQFTQPRRYLTRNTQTGEVFDPYAPAAGTIVSDNSAGKYRSILNSLLQRLPTSGYQEGGEVEASNPLDSAILEEANRRRFIKDLVGGQPREDEVTPEQKMSFLTSLIYGALPGLNDPRVEAAMRSNMLGKANSADLALAGYQSGGEVSFFDFLTNLLRLYGPKPMPENPEAFPTAGFVRGAQGGEVEGPQEPADQVPILATGGELVVPVEDTEAIKSSNSKDPIVQKLQQLAGKPGKGAGSEMQQGGPLGQASIQDLIAMGLAPSAEPRFSDQFRVDSVPAGKPINRVGVAGLAENVGQTQGGVPKFEMTGTPESQGAIDARRLSQDIQMEKARIANLDAFLYQKPTPRLMALRETAMGRLAELENQQVLQGQIAGELAQAQLGASADVQAAELEAQGRLAAAQQQKPIETLKVELARGVKAGDQSAKKALDALNGLASRELGLLEAILENTTDAATINTVLKAAGIELPGELKNTKLGFGSGVYLEQPEQQAAPPGPTPDQVQQQQEAERVKQQVLEILNQLPSQ